MLIVTFHDKEKVVNENAILKKKDHVPSEEYHVIERYLLFVLLLINSLAAGNMILVQDIPQKCEVESLRSIFKEVSMILHTYASTVKWLTSFPSTTTTPKAQQSSSIQSYLFPCFDYHQDWSERGIQ